MTTQLLGMPPVPGRLREMPDVATTGGRVYAIYFDLDIDSLRLHYEGPYNHAFGEVHKFLVGQGYAKQPGNFYCGGDGINAVTCVLTAIELARVLPWFASSVGHIRMIRIEEFNDLMPAVQQAAP